jgi:DtxR family transcriptional regulator, manganese transport regulator
VKPRGKAPAAAKSASKHAQLKRKTSKRKTSKPAQSKHVRSIEAPSNARTLPMSTAEHHRAIRKQHEAEAAQDYCEVIAELLDSGVEARVGRIAARFGLSHVTVSRVVRRLASEGYGVAPARAPLGLTARGRALATEARARHEIVVEFLRAIGVDEATAQADAEGIEHHVSPATLRAMSHVAHANRR